MSDVTNAIMDAAERRMRTGGFKGFSFRDIAADVGVKSSSVHYHYPTKDKLAAAVVRRYADNVRALMDKESKTGADPSVVWARAFRSTLYSEGRMCPATVLGAGSLDLPEEVAVEVQGFFEMCVERLIAGGLSPKSAAELLARITGAMVVARALNDISAYDRATSELIGDVVVH